MHTASESIKLIEMLEMAMVECNFLVELNWVFVVGLILIVDCTLFIAFRWKGASGIGGKETISIYAHIYTSISAK